MWPMRLMVINAALGHFPVKSIHLARDFLSLAQDTRLGRLIYLMASGWGMVALPGGKVGAEMLGVAAVLLGVHLKYIAKDQCIVAQVNTPAQEEERRCLIVCSLKVDLRFTDRTMCQTVTPVMVVSASSQKLQDGCIDTL